MGTLLTRLLLHLMVFYVLGIVLILLQKDFSPWALGDASDVLEVVHSVHSKFFHGGLVGEGHHSLPEEVNDKPKVVRRRLRGKTPILNLVGREASPPPKQRKWLILPGPSRGSQENSHFPRVGVG